MPQDHKSAAERFYDELCSKHLAEQLSKFTKLPVKRETCPYCGSSELVYHRIPFERDGLMVFCIACGESWDKR